MILKRKLISYIHFIVLGLLLYGCSPIKSYYFYSTFHSINENPSHQADGEFHEINKDWDISYSFYGKGITMKMSVLNKTDLPLLMEWEKSTITVNDLSAKPILTFSDLVINKQNQQISQNKQEDFILLNSAYFDMKKLDRRKFKSNKVYISDKKLKTKSVDFDYNDSPLLLTTKVFIRFNGADTVVTNTFYISQISNINKKVYKAIRSESTARGNGFYSSYEKDRGKDSKLMDGIFDQLIKTGVHSVGHDGIKNYSKYDDDAFYVPNR